MFVYVFKFCLVTYVHVLTNYIYLFARGWQFSVFRYKFLPFYLFAPLTAIEFRGDFLIACFCSSFFARCFHEVAKVGVTSL